MRGGGRTRSETTVPPRTARGTGAESSVGVPDAGAAELEQRDLSRPPLHGRGEPEAGAGRLRAHAQPASGGGQARPVRRLRHGLAEEPREPLGRLAREVVAPAVDPRERRGVDAERGEARRPGEAREARAQARDRRRRPVEPSKCGRRRDVAHRDQPRQVLAQDRVGRDGERGLLRVRARERLAVRLGMEAEPDADDEERRGDGGVAGIPGEGERRQA
jgi:hypothetical protein